MQGGKEAGSVGRGAGTTGKEGKGAGKKSSKPREKGKNAAKKKLAAMANQQNEVPEKNSEQALKLSPLLPGQSSEGSTDASPNKISQGKGGSTSRGMPLWPISRIRQEIKNSDHPMAPLAVEAVAAVAFATEMFSEVLMKASVKNTIFSPSVRELQYGSLSVAVSDTPRLNFLKDIIPATMTLAEARKISEKEAEKVVAAIAAPSPPTLPETHPEESMEVDKAQQEVE